MCEKGRKRALQRDLKLYRELGLDVGFVPLHGCNTALNEKGIVVRCPLCGVVMVTWAEKIANRFLDDREMDLDELERINGVKYHAMCPECGIIG